MDNTMWYYNKATEPDIKDGQLNHALFTDSFNCCCASKVDISECAYAHAMCVIEHSLMNRCQQYVFIFPYSKEAKLIVW